MENELNSSTNLGAGSFTIKDLYFSIDADDSALVVKILTLNPKWIEAQWKKMPDVPSPLFWAAEKGAANVAAFLVEKGAEGNVSSNFGGKSALAAAVKAAADLSAGDDKRRKGKEIVGLVLAAGGWKVLIKPEVGMSILKEAMKANDEDLIETLIVAGADTKWKDLRSKEDSEAMEIRKMGASTREGLRKFFAAIKNKDVKTVEEVLDAHPSWIEARSKSLLGTPLMGALQNESYNVVDELIMRGAVVDVEDKNGETPMSVAIAQGAGREVIQQLIENGGWRRLNEKMGEEETTLLIEAVKHNNEEAVEELLRNGVNWNATNRFNVSALHFAKHHKIKSLLQSDPEVLNKFFKDIRKDKVSKVLEILDSHPHWISIRDPKTKLTPLVLASKSGSFNSFHEFLKRGAIFHCDDEDNQLALWRAWDEVWPMDGNVNVNALDENESIFVLSKLLTILDASSSLKKTILQLFGNLGEIKMLFPLYKKEKPTEVSMVISVIESTHLLASLNRVNELQEKISQGADIFEQNVDGETPFSLAFHFRSKETIKFLTSQVQSLRDIQMLADKDQTIIDMLVDFKCYDKVNELLDIFVREDPLVIDKNGNSLLHLASKSGYHSKVVQLLRKGLDPNAQNNQRKTPLHHACEFEQSEVVKELVNHPDYKEVEDIQGKTPLDIVKEKNNIDLSAAYRSKVFEKMQIYHNKRLDSRSNPYPSVYEGIYSIQNDRRKVAIKCLLAANEDHLKMLQAEFDIMFKARDITNVLTPYDVEINHYEIRIAMPLAPLSLLQYINFRANPVKCPLPTGVNESELPNPKDMIKQLILGIKLLHEEGIAHRDIKASNVLLLRRASTYIIKVMDFGSSKVLSEEENQTMTITDGFGTMVYSPPELLLMKVSDRKLKEKFSWNQKCDIFSLGILLFQILAKGRNPFDYSGMDSETQIVTNISQTYKDFYITKVHVDWNLIEADPLFKHLILHMLESDSSKRPTAEQLLHAPALLEFEEKKEIIIDENQNLLNLVISYNRNESKEENVNRQKMIQRLEKNQNLVTGNDFTQIKHPKTKLSILDLKGDEWMGTSKYQVHSSGDLFRYVRNDVIHFDGDLSWYLETFPNFFPDMIRFYLSFPEKFPLPNVNRKPGLQFWYGKMSDLQLEEFESVSGQIKGFDRKNEAEMEAMKIIRDGLQRLDMAQKPIKKELENLERKTNKIENDLRKKRENLERMKSNSGDAEKIKNFEGEITKLQAQLENLKEQISGKEGSIRNTKQMRLLYEVMHKDHNSNSHDNIN